MITILGDYDKINKKLLIIFLSKKTFIDTTLFINENLIENIDITPFSLNIGTLLFNEKRHNCTHYEHG